MAFFYLLFYAEPFSWKRVSAYFCLFLLFLCFQISAVGQTIGPDSLVLRIQGVSYKLLRVDAGSFTMGATDEQGTDYDADETPTHQVEISKSFYIGETEVTQGFYKSVVGSNPSFFDKGDDHPVEQVSYEDALAFCRQLRSLTGRTVTLPTEAQWEYAARGGHKRPLQTKYAGGNGLNKVAWHEGNSRGTTHPVKEKDCNALGLYDMSGNVYEWCLDGYEEYSSESEKDPSGDTDGDSRVMRGGCWHYGSNDCRITHRDSDGPSRSSNFVGFRIVLLP